MIAVAMLLLAQQQAYQPHPRELPETAIEWLDHYGYCLEVNYQRLLNHLGDSQRGQATRRAAVSCWPVRSSAHSEIVQHLDRDVAHADANERNEIADRVLNMAARDFALRVGASARDLTELCAPHTHGDCNASD